MTNPKDCPVCDRRDTERVHTEWWTDTVEEVRVCECGAEFTVEYGNPIKEVTRQP